MRHIPTSAPSVDLNQILSIYISAAIGFLIYMFYLATEHNYFQLLIADLIGTMIVYAASLYYKNTSAYDLYWSIGPLYFVLYLYIQYGTYWTVTEWLIVIAILCWSLRLNYHWTLVWSGWKEEDWRYKMMREKFPAIIFEVINLTGLHLFPTVLVYLGMYPVYTALISSYEPHAFVHMGIFLCFIAVLLEGTADAQLLKFRKQKDRKPNSIYTGGLWKSSRHPNYLGELLFWWGLSITGLAYSTEYISLLGGIGMLLLFLFASIPMIENKMKQRDGFKQYCSTTSMLIPGVL